MELVSLKIARLQRPSADGNTVSIQRDLNGGGIVQQTEVRQTNTDGSTVDTLTNVKSRRVDAKPDSHQRQR